MRWIDNVFIAAGPVTINTSSNYLTAMQAYAFTKYLGHVKLEINDETGWLETLLFQLKIKGGIWFNNWPGELSFHITPSSLSENIIFMSFQFFSTGGLESWSGAPILLDSSFEKDPMMEQALQVGNYIYPIVVTFIVTFSNHRSPLLHNSKCKLF